MHTIDCPTHGPTTTGAYLLVCTKCQKENLTRIFTCPNAIHELFRTLHNCEQHAIACKNSTDTIKTMILQILSKES